MGSAVTSLTFPAPSRDGAATDALLARPDLIYLDTEEGDTIAAVHIRRGVNGTDRAILYSHGNAEDIAHRLQYLELLSQICACDVLAYDYCGYGPSEGAPTEENCVLAIEAAYEYLLQHYPPHRIVAYGRSIGSGPTIDLAVNHPELRGVVLQSPLESCARAIFGEFASWVVYHADMFKNYEKIGKVKCPVLVIHGTSDTIVPLSNGIALHEACRHPAEPLWLKDCGHNNLPAETCLRRVREFLDELDGLSWGWDIFVKNLATHISVTL